MSLLFTGLEQLQSFGTAGQASLILNALMMIIIMSTIVMITSTNLMIQFKDMGAWKCNLAVH